MIIHHPDCLHEGVADGRPDEFEPPKFQVFGHGVGFWTGGWQILPSVGRWTQQRLPTREGPNVAVK